MTFTVLPALDVAAGRLATWTRAGARPQAAADGDPLEAARRAIAAGARWLHLVDLDRAGGGRPSTLALVGETAALGVKVQASGGVVGAAEVDEVLGAGAARAVLASAALGDEAAVASLAAACGERLLVGLEVVGGRIVGRGPKATDLDLDLASTLGWLAAAGAAGFVVTALDRVGALEGPDAGLVRRVARAGRPVIAAGGIRSLDDLRRVREAGAVGAIVGRAWLEGPLDLEAALAWASTA